MFRRVLSGALAALALASLSAAGAAAAPSHRVKSAPENIRQVEGATHINPFTSPHGVFLRGSKGFDVSVEATAGGRPGSGTISINAVGQTGTVTYSVRGEFTHDRIKGSFGRFGEVNLRWVPDGAVREIHGTCSGEHWTRFFDAGAYVGTVRFRGGGGFTEATAHRVAWRRKWYGPHSACGVGISEGFPGPGRLLTANPVEGGPDSPHLSVVQNGPMEKVDCGAWETEKIGRITVSREAFASGKASTLTVPSSFKTGELSPPAPSSGTGRFERTEHAKGTWLGDLSVEFPDGFVQPLAGPTYEANLHSGFREIEEE
jgi:hypothetical protein